MTDTRFDGCF